MPSILLSRGLRRYSRCIVLNLVISGMPSILEYEYEVRNFYDKF